MKYCLNCRTYFYKLEVLCTNCEQPLVECGVIKVMNQPKTSDATVAFNKIFKLSSAKTLKTSLKEGVLLQDAVQHAHAYLNSPECPYTKIQFKYGLTYVILSKLKEE